MATSGFSAPMVGFSLAIDVLPDEIGQGYMWEKCLQENSEIVR